MGCTIVFILGNWALLASCSQETHFFLFEMIWFLEGVLFLNNQWDMIFFFITKKICFFSINRCSSHRNSIFFTLVSIINIIISNCRQIEFSVKGIKPERQERIFKCSISLLLLRWLSETILEINHSFFFRYRAKTHISASFMTCVENCGMYWPDVTFSTLLFRYRALYVGTYLFQLPISTNISTYTSYRR